MDSLVITWRELLIVVVVVLAVYSAEMLLLLRSNKRGGRHGKPDAASLQPRFEAIEIEIEAMREQLLDFKEQLDQFKTAPHPQGANMQPPSPYSQAIQLARQGADVEEVAENCGISRGEAELIVAMHRSKGV